MLLRDAFTAAARRYDLLTRLNPGYRRELRRAAQHLAALLPDTDSGEPPVIWDLGCGTGLSTSALLHELPGARIEGVDASEGMLAHAQSKHWPRGTAFVLGRVEQLPTNPHPALVVAPDGVFAAYLLRNIPEDQRTRALTALRNMLAPGVPVVLHDYSVAESRAAQIKWTIVCCAVVIPLAALSGAKTGLFTYLWRSVMHNDATETVLARLREAGFTQPSVTTARGWHRNVLHTYTAVNPAPHHGAKRTMQGRP